MAAVLGAMALAAPASAGRVLEYHHGKLTPREVAELPPPSGPEAALSGGEQACGAKPAQPPPRARVSAAGTTVARAIAKARRRGTITAAEAASYRRTYAAAHRTRKRIRRYRGELSSVIAVLEGIARRGRLTGGRMPALFLQLRRNTQFWSGHPRFPPRTDIPSEPCSPRPPGTSSKAGSRITFGKSKLVFQYYPGSGLQIQPLANFGLANGLVSHCRHEPTDCDRPGLRKLLSELIAIRSSRGGFTTWEYWFYFGGGTPPWTSGLSRGTAIQALARASEKSILNDKSYLRVAHRSLGVFKTRAPVGVRVKSGRGAHYLIYSFDRHLRVLNAFLQAITGLYDYAKVSGDHVARSLWKAGDRAARGELHLYDTGRWSRYSAGGAESSLGYHRLVTGFLDDLCGRLHGKYCTYYARFRSYLGAKPVVRYTGGDQGMAGRPLRLLYKVNKASCVTAEVTDTGGKLVFRDRKKVARGEHRFLWTPSAPGAYVLTLEAVDQNKNATSPSFTITVQ